jgi:hypothetical protein
VGGGLLDGHAGGFMAGSGARRSALPAVPHLSGTGAVAKEDREFRALRAAALQWPESPAERRKQLDRAADRMNSGVLAEAAGLDLLAQGLTAEAAMRFRTAKNLYVRTEDKLRQDFHLIAIDRAANARTSPCAACATPGRSTARSRKPRALGAWIDLLDPPPPSPLPEIRQSRRPKKS